MFEFGRKSAGYDVSQAAGQRAELSQHIETLERQQRELRVQFAAGEEERLVQVRERSELARNIGELQAQLARAEQDLQFYRGIANPQSSQSRSVGVQQFSVIVRDAAAHKYNLRFALMRESRTEVTVTGTVTMTFDGTRAGAAAAMDLAAVSDAKLRQIPFNFKYFSNFEHSITLPADFKPERVTLEIRPAGAGVSPYKKTYIWNP
jgi:hypothetical protein